MKRSKAKDVADEFLGGNVSEQKPAVISDLSKKMGGLPNTEQLAMIAATLARNTGDAPDVLTNTAMTLWLMAREKIFRADYSEEIGQQDFALDSEYSDYHAFMDDEFFPAIPDEYPVTRDRFLRVMLPKYKSRTADLARIAKAYIRDVLLKRLHREPTPDEIAGAYAKWNQKPFENPDQANGAAMRFKQWHSGYVRECRRVAGLKSAAKKAANKKISALRSK